MIYWTLEKRIQFPKKKIKISTFWKDFISIMLTPYDLIRHHHAGQYAVEIISFFKRTLLLNSFENQNVYRYSMNYYM